MLNFSYFVLSHSNRYPDPTRRYGNSFRPPTTLFVMTQVTGLIIQETDSANQKSASGFYFPLTITSLNQCRNFSRLR